MNKMVRQAVMAIALALLWACGGGGGDSPPAHVAPIANAGASRSLLVGGVVTLDGSASSDSNGTALTYAWTLTSKPAGSTATLNGAATAAPSFTPDVAGDYVLGLTVGDGQSVSTVSSVTVNALPTASLAVVSSQSEPVNTLVDLSLSGPTPEATVTWFADLAQIDVGASVTWNTTQLANGPHQIVAHVQPVSGAAFDVRRTIVVANSVLKVVVGFNRKGNTIDLGVNATSPFGITSVSATLDGNSLGTLTAFNACSTGTGCPDDFYEFQIDALALGTGTHTAIVTVVDGAGNTQQQTVVVPVSNPPVIALDSPIDGAIVSGTLHVSGLSSSDKPGAVTLTAKLEDFPLLQTGAGAFSTDFSLAQVPAGSYLLTVIATDSEGAFTRIERTVVVTADASHVYTPLTSLGPAGALLAASTDHVLYTAEDQSVRLRDVAAATEVVLQGASTIAYQTRWQIDGGRVVVQGHGSDCDASFECVYLWQADGTRTNLTTANPWAGTNYQSYPVARGGYVLWKNDGAVANALPGSYTLYNVATSTYSRILPPAEVTNLANAYFDFSVSGGVVNVVFSGWTTASDAEVYRWTSDTATTVRLSATGLISEFPQTDGTRVVWYEAPLGPPNAPYAIANRGNGLRTLTLPGTATTLAATKALENQYQLRDGVLAWVQLDATGLSQQVAASAAGAATVLSTTTSTPPRLLSDSGGFVVFSDNGKTSSWNAAANQSSVVIDTPVTGVQAAGNTLYFVLGTNQTLYQVKLH